MASVRETIFDKTEGMFVAVIYSKTTKFILTKISETVFRNFGKV